MIGKQRTKKKDFSVGAFAWSPDGSKIAFSATVNPDLVQGVTSDIYLLTLADDSIKKLVSQPGPDNNPRWSPDGKQIVFSSAMGQTIYFASNSRLAIVSAEGGMPRSVTDDFDENPGLVDWKPDGIYFTGLQKTASHLFRVDPETGNIVASNRTGFFAGRVVFAYSLTEGMWHSRQVRRLRWQKSSWPTCATSRREL